MPSLGINIDHIATIREARYREQKDNPNTEPDPVAAALIAESAGACGITAHLREDRRHIQDRDIFLLREKITTKLNLEMGLSEDILKIALKVLPEDVCLVPEHRQEITTEGGLDCVEHRTLLKSFTKTLRGQGIRVSLFIDPDDAQLEAAADIQPEFVELHTGTYANAQGTAREAELARLMDGASQALKLGLRVNAGHGLNYENTSAILKLPGLEELNIGHSIVSRAIFVGMDQAVHEMRRLISHG